MLKISAVYLIGKAEIPIHYTTWSQVEQALSRQTTSKHFFDKLTIDGHTIGLDSISVHTIGVNTLGIKTILTPN